MLQLMKERNAMPGMGLQVLSQASTEARVRWKIKREERDCATEKRLEFGCSNEEDTRQAPPTSTPF